MSAEARAATRFAALAAEAEREARAILAWWGKHAVDAAGGGFHGEIDAEGKPVEGAAKGAVLNARMLWFFSACALDLGEQGARKLADRAADYFAAHFVDLAQGGVYWSVDAGGEALERKKQIYAQAFAISAFCAHHRLTGRSGSLALARELFALLETRARDKAHGGYCEALDEAWSPLSDTRLAQGDETGAKSMNTHLRVLDAYAALHETAPSVQTRAALQAVTDLFLQRIADRGEGHLRLYFEADWTCVSDAISYGHDAEASWLLCEASRVLGDPATAARVRALCLSLARACMEQALWTEGGLIKERRANRLDASRVWWVQAQGLAAFANAYEVSQEAAFLDAFERVWGFVGAHQREAPGDWRWLSTLDPAPRVAPYKAGFWKGPYHNGRAMLELRKRFARMAAAGAPEAG